MGGSTRKGGTLTVSAPVESAARCAGIAAGLEDYLEREGLASIGDVIGTLQMPRREPTAAPR